MEQQTPRPRNIFDLINLNVYEMSQDLCALALRLEQMESTLNDIRTALYPTSESSSEDVAEQANS
jgi:hypothetical protein